MLYYRHFLQRRPPFWRKQEIIDKWNMFFLMIIAFLFLKELMDWKPIVGRTLIAAGAITLIL